MVDLFYLLSWLVFYYSTQDCKKCVFFGKMKNSDYNNSRPFSFLSNIKKILEELMYKSFYTFLNNNNIICNWLFCSRSQFSTSHALFEIFENIRKLFMIDRLAASFCELTKTFDNIVYQILLRKLNHYEYEIKTISLNDICLILISRFLLFLLYKNGFRHTINSSRAYHFADDTNSNLSVLTQSIY